ncbi:MAG: PPC domain-containing protein [Planctomycetales bacterium]|nr:PPC domain-containing protein [Planctomycetales bacterium]
MSRQFNRTAALAVMALAALVGNACAVGLLATPESDLHDYPGIENTGPSEGPPYDFYDAAPPVASGGGTLTVPAYNSLPGAHAKLFLDFDGVNFGATQWASRSPGAAPAYDIDGNPGGFSAEELSRIEQIWSRVAEAYSMFNINVTTVNPGNYNPKESAHLVITSDSTWYGAVGGVALSGGFRSAANMVQHTAWAFSDNLRNGEAKATADAVIHEAGHLFGLDHQAAFNENGTRLPGARGGAYDDNNASETQAPNMGVAYYAGRGQWAIGAAGSNGFTLIDELNVIGGLGTFANDFGYAPDEPGVSFETAPLIQPVSAPMRGVIARNEDVDYYRFELERRSDVSLFVDVAPYGPTLDAKLQIYSSDELLLYTDDPTLATSRGSLTAGFDGALDAGVYYLAIASHGGYAYDNGPHDRVLQDVGQYYLSGSITAVAPEPAACVVAGLATLLTTCRRRRLV